MYIETVGVIAAATLGAIVGSFLNVVVYRIPRGLSVWNPRWSFCPSCGARIPPQFNVPILGWLFLGGQCRHCRSPISIIYPAIEAASALVFVMLWDAFMVARIAPGADTMNQSWAIIATYFVLFSGLLALSAMDIESYSIHIQIPLLAVAVAVVGQFSAGFAISASAEGTRVQLSVLPPALCAASLAAGIGWLVTAILSRGRYVEPIPAEPHDIDPTTPLINADGSMTPPSNTLSSPLSEIAANRSRFQPVPIVLLVLVIAALAAWQAIAPTWGIPLRVPPAGQRAIAANVVLLFMLILASLVHREADQQIVEELERERHQARAMAAHEFLHLLPALLAAIATLIWLRHSGGIRAAWPDVLGSLTQKLPLPAHLAGGVYALSSAILAAAVGWAVRILGTFAFGKEAFGSGDIYILAAIGSVGGVGLVFVGFLLAAILALIGVVATSFHKASRAIPFGPWLALGSFVGLWLERPILFLFRPIGALAWGLISGNPNWLEMD